MSNRILFAPCDRRVALVLAFALAPVASRAGDAKAADPAPAPAAQAAAPATAAAPGKAAPAPADPIVLPAPKTFAAAVDAIAKATGSEPGTIELEDGKKLPVKEGRSFSVDAHTAARILDGSHSAFRKAGFYLFRYERAYGVAGEKDRVGLMQTRDPAVVLRKIGTSGHRHGVTNAQIVTWLTTLNREEPFDLTEVGVDFVAGRFQREPKDPVDLAHRAAKFAPDLVAGHTDPTAGLADLIGKRRTLFLIWD